MKKFISGSLEALLVLNGEIINPKTVLQLMKLSRFIVYTDGAANNHFKFFDSIIPDLVIGDLDSITAQTLTLIKNLKVSIVHSNCQESTDLEKSLQYLVSNNFKSCVVVGHTGGRFDHQISNLQLLSQFSKKLKLVLVEQEGIAFFLGGNETGSLKFEISIPLNSNVSLIPLGTINEITTSGLKYSLNNEQLSWYGRSGQSNLSIEPQISVKISADNQDSLLIYINTNINSYLNSF